MSPSVSVDDHPSLRTSVVMTEFGAPLSELDSGAVRSLLSSAPSEPVPLKSDDAVRSAIRDLLRHAGFRPTGRSKPASEYLIKAAEGGFLSSINPAVDVCNAVSLHSGLPISVIDLDRAAPPFRIGLAPAGASYVFNAAGQTIDLGGLLCLFDDAGPCANPVKDAQRTKTHPGTRRTLSVLWSARGMEARLEIATAWYCELLGRFGAETTVSLGET